MTKIHSKNSREGTENGEDQLKKNTLFVWKLVLKCSRAIMVESAQETGVDPLMKFSCQKNTQLPQGLSLHHGLASNLEWN